MPYRLAASETVSSGMPRILREQVDLIIYNLTDPQIERDLGVHEARKTCKRLRAAYRLIRDEIGKPLYRQENIRFRDIARFLAGARDSWVMVETFDRLLDANPAFVADPDYAKLRANLLAQYQRILESSQHDSAKISMIVDRLDQAKVQIEQLPFQHDDFSALQGGLNRVYRRGWQSLKLTARHPDAENFHEWRKRVKYLWHQVEILELVWPEMLMPLAAELHRLSDYLGDEHDLAVLQEIIRDRPNGLPHPEKMAALMQEIDKSRRSLQNSANLLGLRLYAAAPKSFTPYFETCWQAWRCEPPAVTLQPAQDF